MNGAAYYNEIDPHAAEWIRHLASAGLIPSGDVDERSIEDVCPDDLRGYTQCHFFAGVGVWAYASDRQDGPMIVRSGPVPAHANLSPRRAKALGLLTSGTFGQAGIGSSQSAGLNASLVNRLRERTSILGSTLYKLTWKDWIMPSGLARSRLRGSVRRNSATALTGWPTPRVGNNRGYGKASRAKQARIEDVAQLVGLPTPQARDHKGTQGRHSNLDAPVAAQLLVLPTDIGPMPSGSTASTGKSAPLDPAHSRWLMGLPPEWNDYAVTATQSLRLRQSSSSKPMSEK